MAHKDAGRMSMLYGFRLSAGTEESRVHHLRGASVSGGGRSLAHHGDISPAMRHGRTKDEATSSAESESTPLIASSPPASLIAVSCTASSYRVIKSVAEQQRSRHSQEGDLKRQCASFAARTGAHQ